MATKGNRSSGSQLNKRGVAQGVSLVDPSTGFPVCVKLVDGEYRLCVDANLSASGIVVDVNLDVENDGVHIGDQTTGDLLKINPDGSLNANVVLDAKDDDNVAISAHPEANQIFTENSDTLTSTTPKTIFTYTSTSDNTRILKIECVAFTNSVFRLKIDGSTKKVKLSEAGKPNIEFVFDEHRPLSNGQVLTIEAQASRYFNNNGPYETFVSLEGYLCS